MNWIKAAQSLFVVTLLALLGGCDVRKPEAKKATPRPRIVVEYHRPKPRATPTPTPLPRSRIADVNCGFSFEVPRHWELRLIHEQRDSEVICRYLLRPPGWAAEVDGSTVELPKFKITIVAGGGSFDDHAKWSGFIHSDGEWAVKGRGGWQNSASIRDDEGRKVLKGQAPVGSHFKNGGYAGSYDEKRFVIEGPSGTVVTISGFGIEVSQIEQTLQFVADPEDS